MTLVLRFIFFSSFILILPIQEGILSSGGLLLNYEILVSSFRLEFCVALDTISVRRVILVLLISGCVFLFSHVYTEKEVHKDRFILLLRGFVFSMLILLVRRRIPLLLVGWDGLGVTSFLLIVYYDSKTNNRSGIITFCVNRLGDAILIRTLILFLIEGSLHISGLHLSISLAVCYMLVRITKRAQYPFSMWLPLAIDAPTPVSALVHRRTLVTAGLFLIARIIPESYNPYLMLVGGVTLCVGGFCALISTDLKKLIANSTLSNLGLMAFTLSTSNKSLIIFHLYSHALFKAGLFITAGAVLIRRFGVQDRRSLYGIGKNSPLLRTLLRSFFICSTGTFFLSTFFSKHQVVLTVQALPVNLLSILIIFLGVVLTTLYRLRFLYIILRSKIKLNLVSEVRNRVLFSVGLLAFSSV